MNTREWGMFGLLGLVWGSSFLWIKIALGNGGEPVFGIPMTGDHAGFSPLLLVAVRIAFGLAGLAVLMWLRGLRLPSDPRVLGASAAVGLFNTALPFTLITWGETQIPSGLAAILNGTVPLFTLVIAHFMLHDEPMTPMRFVGLIVGFLGVVVLVGRNATGGSASVWGQLAVVAAAICYAGSAAFSRKYLRGQSPITQSFTTLLFAVGFMALGVWGFERPVAIPTHPIAWGAAVWLGLLGSCLAYLLYFSLINAWGATRASLVTYVFPVVGLLLGITVLGEAIDWRLLAGTTMVVGGIVIVNARAIATAIAARETPALR